MIDDDKPIRPTPAETEALRSRLKAFAQGDAASPLERLLSGLDRELTSLASRYAAALPADGVWIPVSDALAKGLLAAFPDRRGFSVCQVQAEDRTQRWDVGDGQLVCRLVVELPADIPPSARGRYYVSRAALEARVAAPPLRRMGADRYQSVFAPVAAIEASGANSEPVGYAQDGWMDIDAALLALPVEESSFATIGGLMIRRVARVIEGFGDCIARAGWRSEHRVAGAPWVLQCLEGNSDAGIASLTLYALPWHDAPGTKASPPPEERPAASPPEAPTPEPEAGLTQIEPLSLPGPVESRFAGVVAIPWARLAGTSYVAVLQAIARELAKRKPRATPVVVWAWHSSLIGFGSDADGAALYLGLTPGRAGGSASMLKLCGPFAEMAAMVEDGRLERAAAPVLAQAPTTGGVCQIVEDRGGRTVVRRLLMDPGPIVAFLPAGAFDESNVTGWPTTLFRHAIVGGR
jgi:hypothetical protein